MKKKKIKNLKLNKIQIAKLNNPDAIKGGGDILDDLADFFSYMGMCPSNQN